MESWNLCLVGNLLEASNDYVVIDYVVELLYVTFSHVDRLVVMVIYEVLDAIDCIFS